MHLLSGKTEPSMQRKHICLKSHIRIYKVTYLVGAISDDFTHDILLILNLVRQFALVVVNLDLLQHQQMWLMHHEYLSGVHVRE